MGGRSRLPKFKFNFRQKIPHRFTRDFTNRPTDKKKRKNKKYVQNYFNQKSVGVQPCTPL